MTHCNMNVPVCRLTLVVLLVWALLARACPNAAPVAAQQHQCDRQSSRDVRRVVQQMLLPRIEGFRLPTDCPLDTSADRYGQQEAAKEALAGGRWRCRQCGKVFVGERFIDAHLAGRHAYLEPRQGNASHCLADWHEALHARHLVPFLAGAGGWAADPLPCRPGVAAARRAACLELAERCFGGQEGSAHRRLQTHLTAHLCQAHTCERRRKRAHLQAAVRNHRRPWPGSATAAATGMVVLAAFWLLLWLVHSGGGSTSWLVRKISALRRHLAAAAEAGTDGLLQWAVRNNKPHLQ